MNRKKTTNVKISKKVFTNTMPRYIYHLLLFDVVLESHQYLKQGHNSNTHNWLIDCLIFLKFRECFSRSAVLKMYKRQCWNQKHQNLTSTSGKKKKKYFSFMNLSRKNYDTLYFPLYHSYRVICAVRTWDGARKHRKRARIIPLVIYWLSLREAGDTKLVIISQYRKMFQKWF